MCTHESQSPEPPLRRLAVAGGSDQVAAEGPDAFPRSVQEQLAALGAALAESDRMPPDVERLQEKLLALATLIRSDGDAIEAAEHGRILRDLTHIYSRGFSAPNAQAYTNTAADYAQVIGALSEKCPVCDYSEALGQLIGYMGRLFSQRKGSWKTLYKHISAVPGLTEGKPLPTKALLAEIQEWVEAGVDNLFSIRKDLLEHANRVAQSLRRVDGEIMEIEAQLAEARSGPRGKVVSLEHKRRERVLAALRFYRDELATEKDAKDYAASLIEEDIRSFEEKLRATKRVYSLRVVQ